MHHQLSNEESKSNGKITAIVDQSMPSCPLRSLGLLGLHGYNKATYPKSWGVLGKQMRSLVPHEWIYDKRLIDCKGSDMDIAVLTSTNIEQNSQFSIAPTIGAYQGGLLNGSLVIVIDQEKFELRGELRPLVEEPWIERRLYNDLYQRAKTWFSEKGFDFRIGDTKSAYFQLQAIILHQVRDEKIKNLSSFLEAAKEAPYLPFWKDLGIALGKGIQLPTVNRNEIASFLSRYMELEADNCVLTDFCQYLLNDGMRLLNPGVRKQLLRESRANYELSLEEVSRVTNEFAAEVNNHGRGIRLH